MRVMLAVADEGACGLYRVQFPAHHLTGEVDTEVVTGLPIRSTRDKKVVSVDPIDADVLVIQRPLNRLLADAIPHFQAQGVAVVVEIDDDLNSLPTANAAWKRIHPRRQELARACRAADLVTVSTPALAGRYARHGRYIVVPNVVPGWLLDVTADRDGRTVGWSGAVANHPYDLETTSGAVQQALNRGDRFRVIGIGAGVRDALRLDNEPTSTGWQPYEDYIRSLAALDVGIVPLHDSVFNQSKSALKGLEMAALGIPFVASPAPDYQRIFRSDGIGTIARKPREWRGWIRHLLDDPQMRDDWAATAQWAVRDRHTFETQAWRWAEAWEHATRSKGRVNA